MGKKALKVAILLFILLLGISPFALSIIGKKHLISELEELQILIDEDVKLLNVSLTSYKYGYLVSKGKITVSSKDSVIKKEINFKLNNLPDFEKLFNKQKIVFTFSGVVPKIEIEDIMGKEKFSLTSVLNNFLIDQILVDGELHYPDGLEIKAKIPNLRFNKDSNSIANFWIETTINEHHYDLRFGFNSFDMDMKIFKIGTNNFVFKGKQGRKDHNQGGEASLEIDLNSPQLKIDGGVKLLLAIKHNINSKYNIKSPLKTAYDLKMKNLFNLEIKIGKSSIKFDGVMTMEKKDDPALADKEDGYYPLFKGKVVININSAEKYHGLYKGIIHKFVDNKQEYLDKYGIDISKDIVIFDYEVKSKKIYINNHLYFNCPYKKIDGTEYRVQELKDVPLEKIYSGAMEDLFIEKRDDHKMTEFSESLCQLKYSTEVLNENDHVGEMLYQLLLIKQNYEMTKFGQIFLKAYKDSIAIIGAKLDKSPELLILAKKLHCILDPKGEPCTKNEELVSFNSPHQLLTLFEEMQKIEVSLEHVKSVDIEKISDPYLKLLYAYVMLKIELAYLVQTKTLDKLPEVISLYEKYFFKNIIKHEKAKIICQNNNDDQCLALIEEIGLKNLPNTLLKNYLNIISAKLEKKITKLKKDECVQLLENVYQSISSAPKEQQRWKPQWWSQHPGIMALEKNCQTLNGNK